MRSALVLVALAWAWIAHEQRARVSNGRPVVRIEGDGTPHRTRVTVDGVMLPCRAVTWHCDASDGMSRTYIELDLVAASLELPLAGAPYPGAVLCHHCKTWGMPGEDHSCSCPFSDEACWAHHV